MSPEKCAAVSAKDMRKTRTSSVSRESSARRATGMLIFSRCRSAMAILRFRSSRTRTYAPVRLSKPLFFDPLSVSGFARATSHGGGRGRGYAGAYGGSCRKAWRPSPPLPKWGRCGSSEARDRDGEGACHAMRLRCPLERGREPCRKRAGEGTNAIALPGREGAQVDPGRQRPCMAGI